MHTDPYAGYTLPARITTLPNRFGAAECIAADGTVTLWLLDPVAWVDGTDAAGCADTCCAPHEQTGPLPDSDRTKRART